MSYLFRAIPFMPDSRRILRCNMCCSSKVLPGPIPHFIYVRKREMLIPRSFKHLQALDLSDDIEGLRGTCPICCGEEQIMSMVLEKLDTVEENTTDFALNFPLVSVIISPSVKRRRTSSLTVFVVTGRRASKAECDHDIELVYTFPVCSSLPEAHLPGEHRSYHSYGLLPRPKQEVHQSRAHSIARLATGASGILQLSMAIIEQTLETKDWCAKDSEDLEIISRQQVLDWTLRKLLQRWESREDFTETGRWAAYPQALLWAVSDYNQAHLDC